MISVETAILRWPWAVLLLWMAAFFCELSRSADVLSAVGVAGVVIIPPLLFLAWLSVVSPVLLKHSFRRAKKVVTEEKVREVEAAPPPRRKRRHARVMD